jgi:hypothetical protein
LPILWWASSKTEINLTDLILKSQYLQLDLVDNKCSFTGLDN